MTFCWDQLKIRMEDVVSSLLKNIDYTTQENVKKKNIALCFADQKDVRIIRVSIHGSNSSVLLTNISAKLACNSSFFETINKYFSMPAVAFLVFNNFLKPCSKVRKSAVPTNIRASVIILSFASSVIFTTNCQCGY